MDVCVCGFGSRRVQNVGSQKKKKKNKHHVISPMCPMLNFGMWGDLTDVITHAKFFLDWFMGFRVLTPQFFPFSIGLAGSLLLRFRLFSVMFAMHGELQASIINMTCMSYILQFLIIP